MIGSGNRPCIFRQTAVPQGGGLLFVLVSAGFRRKKTHGLPLPGSRAFFVRKRGKGSALYAAVGNAADDGLGQQHEEQQSGQEHDDHSREQAAPVAGVLHGGENAFQAGPTDMLRSLEAKIKDMKYSFQTFMKLKMLTVTMPGWIRGSMIFQKMRMGGHPSMAAASS